MSHCWSVFTALGRRPALRIRRLLALAASALVFGTAALAQVPSDPGRTGTIMPAAPGVLQTQALPSSTVTNGRIGSGDILRITVLGQPDLSAEVGVNDKGSIAVALIGDVPVAGLSTSAAAMRIAELLRTGGFLLKPEVSVDAVQIRSQMVSVLGEVRQPGRYPIPGRLTVLELLATAGGLTEQAEQTVTLLRLADPAAAAAAAAGNVPASADAVPPGGGERIPIRLGDASIGGSNRTALDAELRTGDVVYVERKKLFYIHGEVNRPGAYPMEPGMTVMRAIALGGGTNLRASLRRIDIHRTVNGTDQPFRAGIAEPVQPGDTVFVNESLF
ncbi:SLBB domain-containing protein [Xylophilus sp. GOD-11R]|uniref:SLBB domain-containing protein n=1 Tax=Xylophilus sp. GOD-11R TaxID=3089814 RepID=UPI00298BF2E8|nr:SLBB domain-containing protein [Xylophilus sp. GOD-11R]WPB56118.1 SLBB domain-containing protein [Xylophilus sp. GOD-11R]